MTSVSWWKWWNTLRNHQMHNMSRHFQTMGQPLCVLQHHHPFKATFQGGDHTKIAESPRCRFCGEEGLQDTFKIYAYMFKAPPQRHLEQCSLHLGYISSKRWCWYNGPLVDKWSPRESHYKNVRMPTGSCLFKTPCFLFQGFGGVGTPSDPRTPEHGMTVADVATEKRI